jgi:hypothetical protein
LPFSFFHFKLIEVVHSSSGSSHVKIVCSNTWFFEKLYISYLLVAHDYGILERKMDYCYQLILSTWLEKGMPHIRKENINF